VAAPNSSVNQIYSQPQTSVQVLVVMAPVQEPDLRTVALEQLAINI